MHTALFSRMRTTSGPDCTRIPQTPKRMRERIRPYADTISTRLKRPLLADHVQQADAAVLMEVAVNQLKSIVGEDAV